MKWIKKGLIFDNDEQRAQMPTAMVMKDRIRIYYNIRDKNNRARMHYVDVDKKNPKKIIGKSKKEVLPLGQRGAFDDAGVMPSCIVEEDSNIYLYYVGFSLAQSVPYKCQMGVAISVNKGKTFKKGYLTIAHITLPIYLHTTPTIYEEKVWYANGTSWIMSNTKLEPVYLICHDNEPCIPTKLKHEAQCRPAVIKIEDIYHMWFSYRDSFDFRGGKGSYRMGYATSKDSIKWKRNDRKGGITIGKKGEFDHEMICYPNILQVGEKYLMFYCGNSFGKSGIGCAELKI